jgi:guanylate kinase
MARAGILFVLVGPSGAGKNTLMKRVQEQLGDLPQLATMTTRAQRADEKSGREHWFVSHAEFQTLINTNALVEWQRVHLDDLYGTPRRTVEEALDADRDLIADVEFLGAEKLYDTYPDNTVLIFVTPPSLDILADRILKRGNVTPEALQDRIERAKFEMTFAPRCDYLILNDEIEPAADDLRQAIQSERIRRRDPSAGPPPIAERHHFHTTITAVIQRGNQLLVRANQPPAFQVTDNNQPPHEALQHALTQVFNQPVRVGAISDSRFDFVAPDHVTIDCTPPNVYMNFYYRCELEEPLSAALPDWTWQPLDQLNLPAAVHAVVAP